MLPLEGITVVAVEQAVAASFATRQLADLGARVIKIERPGGGDFARDYDRSVKGLSSHFVWLNRGKESLTLDLKQPEGAEILAVLLARADVFVQNLAPGAIERLGFDDALLRARHPRLIVCHVSGYGRTGPYAAKKAYDALIQAETGLFSITGTPETPSKAGIAVADIAAGMYAYSGILTALLVRSRTGCGTVVEVSLFDALAEWMGYPAYYAMGGTPPARTGASHATIAPYGLFPCGDGGVIMLSIQNEREWARFCTQVLDRPDLAEDDRFCTNRARVANRPALREAIERVFGQFSLNEVAARLEDAAIAYAQARTMAEFLDHPQLQARDRWRAIDSPAGPIPALLPPVDLVGIDASLGPIPGLGEQTDAILRELGHDAAQIGRLRTAGVC